MSMRRNVNSYNTDHKNRNRNTITLNSVLDVGSAPKPPEWLPDTMYDTYARSVRDVGVRDVNLSMKTYTEELEKYVHAATEKAIAEREIEIYREKLQAEAYSHIPS